MIVSSRIIRRSNNSSIQHSIITALNESPALALNIGAIVVAFPWYILYHTKDNPEKYFKKIGFEGAVREYQFSKKLFRYTLAIYILSVFIFVLGLFYFGFIRAIDPRAPLDFTADIVIILNLISTLFFPASIVLAIRFALQHTRKNFYFYLARAYFLETSQKEDSVEKFKYLILLLDTYNKFLGKNLKLKIKDIISIYSIIIPSSAEQKIMITESIGKALEKDKLELARQLAELSNLPNKEQFLIKERTILSQQFKDALTTIIPAVITIVTFIITTFSQVGIFSLQS